MFLEFAVLTPSSSPSPLLFYHPFILATHRLGEREWEQLVVLWRRVPCAAAVNRAQTEHGVGCGWFEKITKQMLKTFLHIMMSFLKLTLFIIKFQICSLIFWGHLLKHNLLISKLLRRNCRGLYHADDPTSWACFSLPKGSCNQKPSRNTSFFLSSIKRNDRRSTSTKIRKA